MYILLNIYIYLNTFITKHFTKLPLAKDRYLPDTPI